MAPSLITLTTDFGQGNAYAPQMKGVILGLNVAAQVIDITHAVPPFDIAAGARTLAETCPWFPPHSLHIGVVDPGVGSARQLVYARCGNQRYLAPNNGLLGEVAQRYGASEIFALENREFWLPETSSTFHGRDILAPVAAHLSLGVEPCRLGRPLAELVRLSPELPQWQAGELAGQVVAVDPFGNLITDLAATLLPGAGQHPLAIECQGASFEFVRTYSDRPPHSLVALFGSGGMLELAAVCGSAASLVGARPGSHVVVRPGPR